MRKLDDVSAADLRDALADAEDAKAAKRLLIAIAYKDGVDVGALSDRYGIPQSTIYYWLDRFEGESIESAITDEQRPGRPSRLSEDERATVEQWIEAPPSEAGIDADAEEWTPDLLREQISEAFGVTYSLGHVRRILRERSND